MDDIAAALGELLGCWVSVPDADGRSLAAYGAVPDPLPRAAVALSEASGRLAGADGAWAVAVTAAGQRLGTLVLDGRPDLDGGRGRTVERAALVNTVTQRLERVAALLGEDWAEPDRALEIHLALRLRRLCARRV